MDDSTVMFSGFFIAALFAVAIGQDAEKRGMSGALWGLMTFLLAIVTIPIYFLVRKPLPGQINPAIGGHAGLRICPKCNLLNQPSDNFCKDCGSPMK